MKKFIIALVAVFSTLIYIASPLFIIPIKAHAEGSYRTKEQLKSDWETYNYYVYATGTRNGENYAFIWCFNSYNESNAVVEPTHICIQNAISVGSLGGSYSFGYNPPSNPNAVSLGGGEFNKFDVNMESSTIIYQNQYNYTGFTCDYIESNLLPQDLTSSVFVSFSPTLSGNVDRSINNNGVISMRSQLYMQVVNQSNTPIQYKMAIYKKHQQTTRNFDLTTSDNVFYDNDPIFVYYGDSWVYCTNCDDENTFLNADTVKENKSSPWHYVSASSQDIVTFDFNQINMLEGEEYTVYVYAVRNDYGYASEQIVYLASSDPASAALYQIQGDDIETVYQSDFVMINYNDVKYDPNNSNNGVKPFNGRDGFAATQQYSYSRNARENQDGTIDYSSRNLYTNQNSWLSQQRSNALANHSTYSSGRVPASLSTHFNNFLSFVTAIFGRMPTDIQSLYIYGFIALVVLGIVLKVVK